MHLEPSELAALHDDLAINPTLVPALAEGAAVAVAPGVVDRPPVGARAPGQRDLLLDIRLVRVEGAARLLAGRALAREGSGEWTAALADYDAALATAASAGLPRF